MNTFLFLFLLANCQNETSLELLKFSKPTHVVVRLFPITARPARRVTRERLEDFPWVEAEFRGARLDQFLAAMKISEFREITKPEELSRDLRLIVQFYFEGIQKPVVFLGTRFDIYDEFELVFRTMDRDFLELLWPIGPLSIRSKN